MSLFGKKPEPPPASQPSSQPNDEPHRYAPATSRSYGVADLIRLLKTIPVDQHPDLVVRVVKTTLESVGVQSSQVIDDAVRLEAAINEQMATLEGEIEALTAEIRVRRERIAELNVERADTTNAKERLLGAEGESGPSTPGDSASSTKQRSLPPPLPPPFHKSPSGKPPEPTPSS